MSYDVCRECRQPTFRCACVRQCPQCRERSIKSLWFYERCPHCTKPWLPQFDLERATMEECEELDRGISGEGE